MQQTIPTILHRNYQKQPFSSQTPSSQHSHSSPSIIPHSLSSSQTSLRPAAVAAASTTTATNRSPKRPLEPELAAASSQSTLSNKKTIKNTTTATPTSVANSPKRSHPSPPSTPVRREKKQSTTASVTTTTNDSDSISSPSSSPPRAHYFEAEELGGGEEGNVIDLSSIPASLDSVVNDPTSPLRTSPVRNQSENIPTIKKKEEEESKEEIADFTSLLCPTPRPALSDSTNNKSAKGVKGNKGKNAVLVKTNNANLINNVANATKARHQHGAGQTCMACDKVTRNGIN